MNLAMEFGSFANGDWFRSRTKSAVAAIIAALALVVMSAAQAQQQPPVFTSDAPPSGAWHVPYSFTLTATGNPAPRFTVLFDPIILPPGLTINGTTGVISGTPTSAGTYQGQFLASNGVGAGALQNYTIVIAPNQTISFAALSNRALGTPPFALTATASSGLPVTYASSTQSVCSILNASLTLIATGTCTVRASQAGNASFSKATDVSQSFMVTAGGTQAQTISFGALGNKVWGAAPFALSATASSVLPVTFISLTTSVCSVSGSTVTIVAVGACTIRASQVGNATYASAPTVDQSFAISNALLGQAINFPAQSSKVLGATPFTIGATASSGLTVAFTSLTTGVCTIFGATVTLLTTGTCTIRASQTGNANYAPAPNIDQGFVVSPPTLTAQTIAFVAPGNRPYGAPPFEVNLSASSGLTVSAASLTPAICTLNGTTVTVTAIGTCTIRASQAGNATFSPAPNVDRSFVVTTAAQTINFSLVGPYYLDTAPAAIHASATSGLPVGFSSMTPTVCRMNDNSLTVLTMGTCTIRASQSGSANYSAAPVVDQSFAVQPAIQTLLFPQPIMQYLFHPQFQPQATASSGLPVTLSSLSPAVCTVNTNVVTLLAAGTCALRATQSGDSRYAAVSLDRSVAVSDIAYTYPSVAAPGPFIAYSTLLGGYGPSGGYGQDKAFDVVVGPDGGAYVAGSVAESYFPGIGSATFSNGGLDLMYVAKLSPDRGRVEAATIVGARSSLVTDDGAFAYVGHDQVEAIAISASGDVHVAAYASSVNYPVTGGVYVRAGQKSIFRVGSDGGVQLLSAIVDSAVTTIRALALDNTGAIYITGVAGPGLATTASAAISSASTPTGGPYLIKFAAGGTSIVYATYLSIAGSRSSVAPDPQRSLIDNATTGYAIAVDASGNAYVAGQATANDFPATDGAVDTLDNKNRDAFIAKVNPNGTALVWVARFGGADEERATSVALAPDGGVVIGGKSATLPDQGPHGFQATFSYDMQLVEREHGFIAKLAPDGGRWTFVEPIGSEGGNLVRGAFDSPHPSPIKVAVDAAGAIYATGNTAVDRTLPVAIIDERYAWNAIQSPAYYQDGSGIASTSLDGVFRANGGFLMKVSPDGKQLLYSVIVSQGRVTGLAVDAFGAAYVTGYGAGLPQINATQAAPGSVFVAKVISQPSPVALTTSPSSSIPGQTVTLSATLGDRRYAGSMEFRDGAQLIATVPVANGIASFSPSLPLGIHRLNATFAGAGPFNGAMSPEVLHVVDQAGTGP